jgi:hypothetical protein
MPDQHQPAQPSLVILLALRTAQIAAVVAALFVIYTEGATAFLNTQEALRVKAVTDNAAVRQKGEAEIAEQQARTQLETARNAAERQKAEADKAEADAQKAEAEAITLGQGARNAGLKARSEAASLTYEAEIRRNKAISELEAARVAARQFAAQLIGDQRGKTIEPLAHRLLITGLFGLSERGG